MSAADDTEKLVRYVVTSLVDDPDAVTITRTDSDSGVRFDVEVAPDDTGKVIGRQGRIIKAIRTLARAAGSMEDRGVEVEIVG